MGDVKIRILVDAHVIDHSFQGTATYIIGLYNALVKYDDIEITLCAFDVEKLMIHFSDERFKFIKLTTESKIKRLAIELPAIIKRERFDLAHFQYIAPLVKDCKFINTIHDLLFLEHKQYFSWSYRFKNMLLFKLSALRSDLILTVSNYSKDQIVKLFNIKADNIFVTPNAISLNPKREIFKPILASKKYILYVSRFEPRKNHIAVLRAYINLNLSKQGYDLVFVGSKKEPIEEYAYSNLVNAIPTNISDRVKFYEFLSYEELNYLYANASCFVFPSLAEGFGIPPIEAAINNCKVLSSNSTAMADFDFFKYKFDPNSQTDLEENLLAVLADNKYPFDSIRKSVESRFNWNTIAANYYKILTRNYENSDFRNKRNS